MIKNLTIEGKWQAIRSWVEELIRDGWTEIERTGEPDFRFTRVTLVRKSR
jgi:hypothetical protein